MSKPNQLTCKHTETRVTRTVREESTTKRHRKCNACGAEFWTTEKKDIPRIMVIKRLGARQRFSFEKLLESIEKACAQLSIDYTQLETAAQIVTDRVSVGPEIESYEIGRLVLEELEKIHTLAWLRFASYYVQVKRQSDLDLIKLEMKKVINEPRPSKI